MAQFSSTNKQLMESLVNEEEKAWAVVFLAVMNL